MSKRFSLVSVPFLLSFPQKYLNGASGWGWSACDYGTDKKDGEGTSYHKGSWSRDQVARGRGYTDMSFGKGQEVPSGQ